MIQYDAQDKIMEKIAVVLKKRMKTDNTIRLVIDDSMGEFCGKIQGNVISAGSYAQLLDTAGRYLRNPQIKDGVFFSYKKMPAMYFCTHFNNYMDAAPLEEIYTYIEDLALWGMGVLKVWFDMHHFRNMEEGKEKSTRLIAILKYAKALGLKTCMTTLGNEAFADSPGELRADWTCGHDGYVKKLNDHFHLEICPSKKGGLEKILEYRRQMLEVFKDVQIDYVSICPYDEGGCTCSECAPWASNGFLRCCEAVIPLIREYFPNAQIVMSLWVVGLFRENDEEYIAIQKALEEGRFPEVKYLLAMYGTYPCSHDMHRPLLSFPEISMTNTAPWGGYGANPMPGRFGDLWIKYRDGQEGGWPYLEGIYADLNAVIMLRSYRDNQPAEVTVKEYLAYEFGLQGEMLKKVCKSIYDMEETLYRSFDKKAHRYEISKSEKVFEIEKTFLEAHETLPEEVRECIKWQVLYLRALIDGELKRNDYYRNDKVMGYFQKLIDISHLHQSGVYTKPDIVEDENQYQDIVYE